MEVTLRNTGTTTWSRGNAHFLGSENPRDNTVWGTNRMLMAQGDSTSPGGTYTFGARLMAPSQAGTYAMQQWFRGVDPRPSCGLIRGLATEYTQSGGTERIRDVIGFPNRMRRRGTLSIQPLGDGCRLICRVDRERLDTSDHRIFRQQRSINDLPNQTPIERDAGLTASQEQAWTSLPRDRALEQDILELIRSRTGSSSPEENPDGA